MLKRFRRRMFPLTLSRALVIVRRAAARNRPETNKFDRPIETLVEYLGGDARITDIALEHIAEWYTYLKSLNSQRHPDRRLSPWTVDSYARMVRAFFNHLVRMGHLEHSPCRRLRIPALPKKHRKDISQDDIALLLKHSQRNARDRAIVAVLAETGCRVGELVSMTTGQLHFRRYKDEKGQKRLCGWALVYGQKVNRYRHAVFGHRAARALKTYLQARPVVSFDNLWLAYDCRPLTTSGVYQMLKRLARESGVTRFNPHSFRHALAKKMARERMPAGLLQELMGHKDPASTAGYIQFDADELLDEYLRYNRADL